MYSRRGARGACDSSLFLVFVDSSIRAVGLPGGRVHAERLDGGVRNGVAAVHADALRRRRRAELEVVVEPKVRAARGHRVLQSEEHRRAQEEGRLAHRLGRVHRELVVRAVQQLHPQVPRHVVKGRQLVVAGAGRQEAPGRRLEPGVLGLVRARLREDELFRGEPAGALHEGALDLAHVERGIHGAAEVHEDVRAADFKVSREAVDLHLGHGRALGPVVEGLAALGLGHVPGVAAALGVDGVEAVRRQVDAVEEGVAGHGRQVQGLLGGRAARVDRLQALQDLVAGVQRGHAVEVRRHRGRGRRRVGHAVRGRLLHVHLAQLHAKGLGHHLAHLGVEALAHLRAAVGDEQRAVDVQVHEGAPLVQQFGREVDAELGGDERDAALSVRVPRVERGHLLDALIVLGRLAHALAAAGHAPGAARGDGLAEVRHAVRRVQVREAQRVAAVRVPQRVRQVGHDVLREHHALGAPEAAEGRRGRDRRPAHDAPSPERGPVVDVVAVQQRAVHDGAREVQGGAAVGVELHVEALELQRLGVDGRRVPADERVAHARRPHVHVSFER
mmetsp:Transcript_8144/g.24353  ORF Transcript_8144/g.24353 Transcript_8144/m.24353 type:complete len:559 (+) Transcript_8144:37-1713(+)